MPDYISWVRKFLKTWPAWQAFSMFILPTVSLGVTGPPRSYEEVKGFPYLRVLTVFSSELNRAWLWAQAVVTELFIY